MKHSKYFRLQKGATLLEIMLALGIAGTFLVLGVRMYQSFQETLAIKELQDNVDQLFQAAANYYQANCAAGEFSPNPPSFLSPYPSGSGISYPPTATSYFSVGILGNLMANGYLTQSLPANSLVDPSGGESGYVVQLNPIISSTPLPVSACTVIKPGSNASPSVAGTACVASTPTSTIPTTQALLVSWNVQVAVKIKAVSKIRGFAAALGADCVSGLSSGGTSSTVDACPSSNSGQNYLVWQRAPSAATIIKRGSLFAASMPLLKQFDAQYTEDPYYAMNSGYSTTTSPSQAPVYYLCGG